MSNSKEILVEIQEVAPVLAGLQQKTTYQAPKDYFNTLSEKILENIGSGLPTIKNPFSVPDNYFQFLNINVFQKIRQEEVKEELLKIAPLLATIPKTNVFTIPSHYFQNLFFKKPVAAPVFNIKKISRVINYAAAAVVAGILVTGIFIVRQPGSFDLSKEAKKYSDEELNLYLNNSTQQHSSLSADYGLNLLNEPANLKENLKFYSDEELERFLEENGNIEDSSSKSIGGI